MLQFVSDDLIYLFNPTGFVMDEAGGNWNSLKIVYGNDAVSRVVSCEFNFKQSVGRKSGKLSNDLSKEKFESPAYSLLQANTPSVFEKRRTEMNHFIKENPEERGCLRDWGSGGRPGNPTYLERLKAPLKPAPHESRGNRSFHLGKVWCV